MKIAKTITVILALIGFFYVSMLVTFWLRPVCESQTIRTAVSPLAKHTAEIEVVQCPEQKTPELRLAIIENASPNKSTSTVISAATTTDIDLTWKSEKRLQIVYPKSLQLSQDPWSLRGIELEFISR